MHSRRRQAAAAASMFAIGVALALTQRAPAWAHEGPPFPILMDKPAAGYVVSVWADPDIGEAQFFVIVESPSGGKPQKAPQVAMWTEPVSGRLERASYETKKQSLRNQLQFEAKPNFDQRDMWTVGFHVKAPNGEAGELTTEVESTPPGFGPWDLAVYLFPFILLGGMWVMAMVRRSRMSCPPQNIEEADSETHEEEERWAETNVGYEA